MPSLMFYHQMMRMKRKSALLVAHVALVKLPLPQLL
jgi:hypothetical protein